MFNATSHVTRARRALVFFAAAVAGGITLSGWRSAPAARVAVTVVGHVRYAADGSSLGSANIEATFDGKTIGTGQTAADGRYTLRATMPATAPVGATIRVTARRIGFEPGHTSVVAKGDTVRADFILRAAVQSLEAVVVGSAAEPTRSYPRTALPARPAAIDKATAVRPATIIAATPAVGPARRVDDSRLAERRERNARDRDARDRNIQDSSVGGAFNREQYERINDNPFLAVRGNPRSTFSVDVDRSSYGVVRRYLTQERSVPPADAVRIEEMINYFSYDLEAPRGDAPVAITTEAMPAPWQPRHQLVRIALQARRINTENLPPSNLVFLIDVSGSMQSPDKLPLVKQSLRLLVEQLRPQDRVAMVVYAGAAGLALPSTSGEDKARIMAAIDRLEAGGSTAGGAGLELAYRVAREHFERGGNNRVILATDGDFNVGPSSDAAMERLIEGKRSEGTYLTILGYGTGNYQDAKMQKLARVGNGNAAYVDDLAEARKVLVKEMGGTLVTVANDVKLQVEFNPARVASYRLIGYEDRLLRDEDFADDKKDAGDMGAGHTVTALYEVVPVGVRGTVNARESEPLRYTAVDESSATKLVESDELLHVSLRYKRPGESTSRLLTKAVRARTDRSRASDDLRFAASVAAFGMLMRDSEHKGSATAASVLTLARDAMGEDNEGYRSEFVQLVEQWRTLARSVADQSRDRDR